MRAILEDDRIVSLTRSGGVEIGNLPPGVGLERLRWNGKEVIDLADQASFWVEPVGSTYLLHVIQVPGSQQVSMTYPDRYRLTTDPDGTIRLKTDTEMQQEQQQEQLSMLKSKVRVKIREQIGDIEDRLADLQKLVYLLMGALVAKDADAQNQVQDIYQKITNTYPSVSLSVLSDRLSETKKILSTYYQEKSGLK